MNTLWMIVVSVVLSVGCGLQALAGLATSLMPRKWGRVEKEDWDA